jgi:flavin reductase (DIM6/NTAB) family NADH-FMN oxidoreductase RutF
MKTATTDRASIAEDYRLALRNVATPVSVVTTFDDDGQPHGTTVSAFIPLSMDPALVLVSLDNSSRLLGLLDVGAVMGINVLTSEQADVAHQFTLRARGRWTGIAWKPTAGAPAITERLAYISATVRTLAPAGDHTMVIGSVRRADRHHGTPLTYWQRTFGTFRER